MAWRISEREVAAVSALPADRRYRHAVKRIADCEQVWSLRGADGWVLAADDDGREVVPVWPHSRCAEQCATGSWANTEPAPIALDDWLAKWTPGMARDGRCVGVCPLPGGSGAVVEPERFANDIADELSNFE